MKATALAAGGVLGSTVYRDNESWGEIHQLLGESEAETGSYPMINTYNYTSVGETKEYTVDAENFTMTESMGGFSIIVDGQDGNQNAVEIKAPKTGEAPQMIVVSGKWNWPKERVDITDAYPDFQNWSTSATSTEWTGNPTEGSVISR